MSANAEALMDGITRDPNIDFDSVDYQMHLLSTEPCTFIGRKVFQYFGDAVPPGVYIGQILSHERDAESGNFFQVKFPAVGDNLDCCFEYDDDDVRQYCIQKVDGTDIVTSDNLEERLAVCADKQLRVHDFDCYIAKNNDTIVQVCESIGLPKSDWPLYMEWLANFGYGPANNSHPDAIEFPNPWLPDNTKSEKKIAYRTRFKAGTRFPRPRGNTWSDVKRLHTVTSNAANPDYVNRQEQHKMLNVICEHERLRNKCNSSKDGLIYLIRSTEMCDAHSRIWEETIRQTEVDTDGIACAFYQCIANVTSVDSVAQASACVCNCAVANLSRHVDGDDDSIVNYITQFTDADQLHELCSVLQASSVPTVTKYAGVKLSNLTYNDVRHLVDDNAYIDSATGKIVPPKNYKAATTRSDWLLWKYAIDVELTNFITRQVHSQPMTLDECRAEGVSTSAVHSQFVFTCKYDQITGDFVKPKAKWVVTGTPAQMKRGEHYFEIYSPAPCPIATRLMQCIACGKNKHRAAADIVCAFLNSVLEKHEWTILRLPDGMEVVSEGVTRRYVIARRGQYGTPSAALYWQRELDNFLLSAFNNAEWQCVQLSFEKRMFVFTEIQTRCKTHLLVHVDDLDLISDCPQSIAKILSLIDTKYGLKIADPEQMLGVCRHAFTNDIGIRYIEFTQPKFIEDMYDTWRHNRAQAGKPFRNYTPQVPFPPDLMLSVAGTEKCPRPCDTEIE
eukprot:SAG11_NODE_738_length_7426_cov_14.966289_9_plen_729_part_01